MARKKKEIPKYGTVVLKGVEYYRTRIEDADGRRVAFTQGLRKNFLKKWKKHSAKLKMRFSVGQHRLWPNIVSVGSPCNLQEYGQQPL